MRIDRLHIPVRRPQPRLAGIKARTLVIHGADDPLVPVEGGRDTAEAIPGARLKEIPGMGHDLPVELVDEIAGAIAEPFFGIPEWIGQEAFNRLDVPLAGVTRDFRTHYVKG